MWFVFSLRDIFSVYPPSLPPHVWRVPFNHMCVSYTVVWIWKGALKHDLPPSEERRVGRGQRNTEWSTGDQRQRQQTHFTPSLDVICQSSIYLNAVTSKGSLVRRLIFVEISAAIMVQKLTYMLLWWRGDEKREKERYLVTCVQHLEIIWV